MTYPLAAWERAMTVREVMLRALSLRIARAGAAAGLGVEVFSR